MSVRSRAIWIVSAAAAAAAATIWLADSLRANDPDAELPAAAARSVRVPDSSDPRIAAARSIRRPIGDAPPLPPRGSPAIGQADARSSPDRPAPHQGKQPEPELRWRERMDRIDHRARAALGLDDPTAHKLNALQRRLRWLQQDVRDQAGPDGPSREEIALRIQQRTGGFRAQVVKLLGEQRAETYLRIVEDERPVPAAPVARD